MRYRDRLERTERLLERYARFIGPQSADSLRSMVLHGEPGLAVEDLASALVRNKVKLDWGDAVEFRQLLTGFQRCPDTPSDIEDLLLFGEAPSDGYFFYLFDPSDPFAVAAATAECFPVPPERIGVMVDDVPAPGTPDRPLALVQHSPAEGAASVEFSAGPEFVGLVGGVSELAVARSLCRAVGASAMLGAHGLTPNQWMLVTAVGGHGVVMVDGDASDDGRWEILFAYEPIEDAPDLPVR
ncbi:hypothetical protein [Glycomyces buryatensis]|uniref:Uncharacterized protein n=1 Tax=Glycomyces buryatensis TaxID=2570927 RepID=A0A4V4HRY8_9ACTN|nr:hypothetical protein [Glycomyces buryatensis]THV39766.1 hypothetical protein FAB82_16750 [Glycomyces buryatensis]